MSDPLQRPNLPSGPLPRPAPGAMPGTLPAVPIQQPSTVDPPWSPLPSQPGLPTPFPGALPRKMAG